MRKLERERVESAVKDMIIEASYSLNAETEELIKKAKQKETSPYAQKALEIILENIALAREKKKPICQDTGLSVFFVEVGRELCLDFDLTEVINQALRRASKEGFLRASVADPISRKNTGDNAPAIIHYFLTEGDRLKINLLLKGAGSENKSRAMILSPAEGISGIKRLVLETVEKAGGQSCPPLIVGIGLGGSLEMSALLAKKALLRKTGTPSPEPELAELEEELEREINQLGIGASGFGGNITCLSVQIEKFFGHIASLAVTVNLQCWAHRHREVVI